MQGSFNSTDDEINLGEILGALWAHKSIIIVVTVLSIIFSGYKAITAEKKFTANAIFEIKNNNTSGLNYGSELGALATLAGVSTNLSSSNSLLERVSKREFILVVRNKHSLDLDPYFNTYNPNKSKDPFWKATIKRVIGWQATEAERELIVENNIIKNYQKLVKIDEIDGGLISISVTHSKPDKASIYANTFMEEIRNLIEKESIAEQKLRLSYLSETLADAVQDMERTQKALKDYALENSTLAQEFFLSGSLKLDDIRMEKRKVEEISELLTILAKLIKSGNLDFNSYETLRSSNPLIDDVEFRRILGMSEVISAWTWPKIQTIDAVSATLKDRIKKLDIDIKNIEENAKIYATSAEDLAKFTRDAKIAEATYKVLIEQVKSQSVAAGFRPEKFKVFQYATPPLAPSSPQRNKYLVLGAILGLLAGCTFTLFNSLRKGVFYSHTSLKSEVNAKLSLSSKSLRRLSKKSISKISSFISKQSISEINEAEIKLAHQKLIYVMNYGGRPSASGLARLIATQSSQSGRKVALCDITGQSLNELENKSSHMVSGLQLVNIDENLSVMAEEKEANFFTAFNFSSTLKDLLNNFDQVFICCSNKDAALGLLALEGFNPSVILLAGLRNTKKSNIKSVAKNQPIDILFYD